MIVVIEYEVGLYLLVFKRQGRSGNVAKC